MNAQKSYTHRMDNLCLFIASTTPKIDDFFTQRNFFMQKQIKNFVTILLMVFMGYGAMGQACPAPLTVYPSKASVTGIVNSPVVVTASVPLPTGRTVTKVEYFNNSVSLGSSSVGPDYKVSWTPTTTGLFSVSAQVTSSCPGVATPTVGVSSYAIGVTINPIPGSLCSSMFTNCSTGQLSIGLPVFGDQTYKLFVQGGIKTEKIKVEVGKLANGSLGWADYVFAPNYSLMPLQKVEAYIKANRHLPDMPSEKELIKEGVDLIDIITKQQAKIEELYLHVIALEKAIKNKK